MKRRKFFSTIGKCFTACAAFFAVKPDMKSIPNPDYISVPEPDTDYDDSSFYCNYHSQELFFWSNGKWEKI